MRRAGTPGPSASTPWRTIRIAFLLVILSVVAVQTWLDRHRTTSWQRTVWVGVFPSSGDASAAGAAQAAALTESDLVAVTRFVRSESQRHGIVLDEPLQIRLYPSPATTPPRLPSPSTALERLWWSLKLRWYRWRVVNALERSAPTIALFLLFYDPDRHAFLPHSTGLQRGLTGVVHLYAGSEHRAANNVVVAHELLHTFGATDKYDPRNDAPLYPDGYADPQRQPRLPQERAEIMAGRIPVSAEESVMAASLDETLVGPLTAREIGWSNPP
jgi:hypothetical protein